MSYVGYYTLNAAAVLYSVKYETRIIIVFGLLPKNVVYTRPGMYTLLSWQKQINKFVFVSYARRTSNRFNNGFIYFFYTDYRYCFFHFS